MLEFRRDAKRALAAVLRGERLVLTYRGRPVARLEPIRADRVSEVAEDALLRLDEFSVEGPGGTLRNEDIDRALYGR